MSMRLTTLSVHPNAELVRAPQSPNSLGSINIIHPSIPPLKELCLRLLMSPASPSDEVLLNQYKVAGAPIPHIWGGTIIPAELAATLNAIVPGSMAASQDANITPRGNSARGHDVHGKSICPDPSCRRPFLDHAETRITWEEAIAGCKVPPAVPVMWRGCLRGCLDFIAMEKRTDVKHAVADSGMDDLMDEDIVFGGVDMHAGNIELGFEDGA